MANGGSRPRGGGSRRSAARGGKLPGGASAPRARSPRTGPPAPAPVPEAPRTFTLGVVPGATPGKWIGVWRDRMPHVPLDLRETSVADQRAVVEEVDAALVRLPIAASDDLHVIALYDEQPVVVMSAESALAAADDLGLDDLVGEVVIVPADDMLGVAVPGAVPPAFAAPTDTAEAIATVAAGVGVVIVPMSLARANRRRDVEYRVLRDGPLSTVALAWPRERTTPDVETFVGIVRGRTARSSR